MPQDFKVHGVELDSQELDDLNTELNKRGFQLHGDAVYCTEEKEYLDEDEKERLLEALVWSLW